LASAEVSSGGKVFSIRFSNVPDFSLFRAEVGTFFFSGLCVFCGTPPLFTSFFRSLPFFPARAFFTHTAQTVVDADDVARYGLNFTISSTSEFDDLAFTATSVAAALTSSASPLDEPTGFANSKTAMAPKVRVLNAAVVLDLTTSPVSTYKISSDE